MSGVFAYESSKVDWCEENYRHSEHVVEYFNTVRNINWLLYDMIRVILTVTVNPKTFSMGCNLWV